MQEKTDISYGAVPIFRAEDGWKVLLVHQISYRGPNDTFWILPKGHAEEGESPIDAARRELEEETGVKEVHVQTDQSFDVSYSFTHEGVRIHKTVEYYVGICDSKDTEITLPNEIKDLRWCSFEEAKDLVTHQNTRGVLEAVEKTLQ